MNDLLAARRAEAGFTLIELMVVVLIIAILIAIAIPTFLGARTRAQDRAAQQTLTNAAKIEATFQSDNTGYTADAAVLSQEEPQIDWSAATDESVHVVVSVDFSEVLLYTRSGSGTWFGIRLDRGERFTCSGATEGDVNQLADCPATAW